MLIKVNSLSIRFYKIKRPNKKQNKTIVIFSNPHPTFASSLEKISRHNARTAARHKAFVEISGQQVKELFTCPEVVATREQPSPPLLTVQIRAATKLSILSHNRAVGALRGLALII